MALYSYTTATVLRTLPWTLLIGLRVTPAPGYYPCGDRTTMKLEGAKGLNLDRPRRPKSSAHHGEHFGDVMIYFSHVEILVPLILSHGDAGQPCF